MKILKPDWKPEHFFQELLAAPDRALLLDYDGTLAPFCERRDQALPFPGVREALDALMADDACRVVLISGRAVSDLEPLLGLAHLPEIWGSHGWERRHRDGSLEDPALEPATREGLQRAREWAGQHAPGTHFETKPASVALHWRGLSPATAQALEQETRAAWTLLAEGAPLEIRGFDGGLELLASGRNKGDAVRTILAEMDSRTVAAYLGDDHTDEDAFRALHQRNRGRGLAVLVRGELRASEADWWLRPPDQLLDFLERWRRSCRRRPRADDASRQRLVIVSNRLPVSIVRERGRWRLRPSSGGLVTALAPVLRDRGGLWIGWPGTLEDVDLDKLVQAAPSSGYGLEPVTLTADERDKFYYGFSNEVIWPLFHALHTVCNFDPAYWKVYSEVNRKFARVVARNVHGDDFVWVHDYHLMLLARELRRSGVACPLGFFLHIPFPPPDVFLKLPWRRQLLDALLEYDFLGFQTLSFRRNFVRCVQSVFKGAHKTGSGPVATLNVGQRQVRIGYFPISIDFHHFASHAASQEVTELAASLRERLPDRELILGIDRLDYTKGLPYKLAAFRRALERFPELRTRVTLIQVVVPSREEIGPYNDLRSEIERLVGQINGEFTQSGWVPVHYIFRHLERTELLAYYRTAGVALITSLEDGMNLVAKEYCAANLDEDGVVVLSEFAGTAVQMQKFALLVNPYDREAMAETIFQACRMEKSERRQRMRRLRRSIQEHDIFWWVDSFLMGATARELAHFPTRAGHPQHEVVEYT